MSRSLTRLRTGVGLLLLLLVVSACQEDSLMEVEAPVVMTPPPTSSKQYAKADSRLWPYLFAFEAEAAERGIAVDLNTSQITFRIEEIDEEHVAGSCSYYAYHTARDVVIDQAFFERANHYFREMVLFHELGHCYLNRNHLEDQFENGVCKSIMRSGQEGGCRDAYRSDTREYYVDELFFGK